MNAKKVLATAIIATGVASSSLETVKHGRVPFPDVHFEHQDIYGATDRLTYQVNKGTAGTDTWTSVNEFSTDKYPKF